MIKNKKIFLLLVAVAWTRGVAAQTLTTSPFSR